MVAPHLLAAIMNLQKLEFLLLEGFTLRPQLLQHLEHLRELESLVLLQSRISDLECAAIAAYASPRLRNVSLRGSKVTTEGIAMLAGRLTCVEELDIVKTYVCMCVVVPLFLRVTPRSCEYSYLSSTASYISSRLGSLSLHSRQQGDDGGIVMHAGRFAYVEELDIAKTYVCACITLYLSFFMLLCALASVRTW